ncbi:hypothetical protein NA57DRAFT_58171 [Rhizodiscina lignyota]|uniref:Uncharacterized protein n=1 Tax=Rhizodiscina lignyota TaxID=1504668 RepID=A0A9P4I9D1_9PEZI|nr:hypothetical protein NA57DRAFT_58171 [Rhizodiscina lignyota]
MSIDRRWKSPGLRLPSYYLPASHYQPPDTPLLIILFAFIYLSTLPPTLLLQFLPLPTALLLSAVASFILLPASLTLLPASFTFLPASLLASAARFILLRTSLLLSAVASFTLLPASIQHSVSQKMPPINITLNLSDEQAQCLLAFLGLNQSAPENATPTPTADRATTITASTPATTSTAATKANTLNSSSPVKKESVDLIDLTGANTNSSSSKGLKRKATDSFVVSSEDEDEDEDDDDDEENYDAPKGPSKRRKANSREAAVVGSLGGRYKPLAAPEPSRAVPFHEIAVLRGTHGQKQLFHNEETDDTHELFWSETHNGWVEHSSLLPPATPCFHVPGVQQGRPENTSGSDSPFLDDDNATDDELDADIDRKQYKSLALGLQPHPLAKRNAKAIAKRFKAFLPVKVNDTRTIPSILPTAKVYVRCWIPVKLSTLPVTREPSALGTGMQIVSMMRRSAAPKKENRDKDGSYFFPAARKVERMAEMFSKDFRRSPLHYTR